MAVSSRIQSDLLEAAAIVPITKERIDEPRDVRRLRFKLEGADLSATDLDGGGQTVIDAANHIIEVRDPRALSPTRADLEANHYVAPEPLIERRSAIAPFEHAVGRSPAPVRASNVTLVTSTACSKEADDEHSVGAWCCERK
jgi:hypothetical protein